MNASINTSMGRLQANIACNSRASEPAHALTPLVRLTDGTPSANFPATRGELSAIATHGIMDHLLGHYGIPIVDGTPLSAKKTNFGAFVGTAGIG